MKPNGLIWLIVAVYASLGVAYAVNTPTWQAPDEPAHFNYVRTIAEGRGLPVLQVGDYDQAYLEELKAAKFPKDMSVDGLRYESHQPPLYYILASPLLIAGGGLPLEGQVVILRIFSVLLGCLLLMLAYLAARRIFPESRLIALSVTAFIALVPQHVAMSASANNDTLAGLLVVAILLVLAGEIRSTEAPRLSRSMRPTLALGLLLGLALLTKTTAYVALVLIPLGLVLARSLRPKKRRGGTGKRLLVIGVVATLVAGWWFVRNVTVYGLADPLGLMRHDIVAAGQPLFGEIGAAELKTLAAVTFKSFWGQFGWMALPADDRAYILLAALSGLAGLGLILFVMRAFKEKAALTGQQRAWLWVLAAAFVLVAAAMIGYNLRFLQPQGRYLFPAIVPIAFFFTLGLREVISPRYATLVFTLIYAGMLLLNVIFLYRLIPQLA
ncbi:MAG: hypothetical protein HYX92_02790 [Chloroflexi bacterium]|nr:hypothetical protein [Chloroflexota bacterium]